MSSGAQQLKKDFEQVQKLLGTYPDIKIIKTEGDPPEQYDIEYTIKGYKTNPDGSTSPDNSHEVRIILPFGYPHFPPTAKPLTPIFHPDIDPDAIRIADFWQENHSLSELIIHIGQMICGKHYTKDEPFNQSAFEWFEERKSWLPFDILEPREEDDGEEETDKADASPETSDAGPKQSFTPSMDLDLDILKDDLDFPFDDDEEVGEQDDEFSFSIEEDTLNGSLPNLEGGEAADEITLDFGEEESDEPFNLQESGEDENDDLFSLDMDETDDDLSFDLTEELEQAMPVDESSPAGDLFDLDTEEAAGEAGGAEAPIEFASEEITSPFKEDEQIEEEGSEAVDISLDDLAGLDEDALDFGIEGDATVDLSGLEDMAFEENEETIAESDENTGDEEKILSALSLDEDHSSPSRAEEHSEAIRSLIDQKQIFSAKKVLADLPEPDALSDKKELELTIASAVSEAEDLFKKADKHEQKGELEKAGILLDLVANIATDFPGLDFARNRIRESIMDGGKKKPDAAPDEKKTAHDQEKEEDISVPEAGKKKKKSRAKLNVKIPTRLVAATLAAALLGGAGYGGWFVYKSDSKNVQLASTTFQRAEQLVDTKEFQDAKKALDSARAALKEVIFFQGGEKEALLGKITGLANSDMVKEGLKGRVLYGDQFVSVEAAKAIDKFNTQKTYAEQVLKAGKIEQAIPAFEKSLPYAEKAGFAEEIKSITHQILELRFELAMTGAKQFEAEQNWLDAEKEYRNALELSKDISTPEVQNDIANRLAMASYRQGLHEGLKAINNSEWQKSIDAFQSVKNILEKNPQIAPETERAEINKLLIQSHLYLELSTAKKAYENKEWKRALDIYNDAVALLKENASLLGQEAIDNIKKIEKTILTTHVAREQIEVAVTKAENALDKTVEHYEAIANLIESSAFKTDETLAKILDDARSKTTEIKNQLLISKREQWLTDNYEKIFRDNYPSAELSELLNPKIRFVKREENIMIFNISCTERKQGRTFRLELNYQYDLDKDAWSLYSGKIEEE